MKYCIRLRFTDTTIVWYTQILSSKISLGTNSLRTHCFLKLTISFEVKHVNQFSHS